MTKLNWLVGIMAAGAGVFMLWQNHQLGDRIDGISRELGRAGHAPPLPAPSLASCYLSPMFARQLANELHATLASPPAGEPAPATRVADAPTAASTEAAEQANHSLDEIIHRGRITPDDLNTLRGELATATTAQRDQLHARIAAALNRDEIVAVDPHALYP